MLIYVVAVVILATSQHCLAGSCNGGIAIPWNGEIECICPPHKQGKYCVEDVPGVEICNSSWPEIQNACASNPCYGGECINLFGGNYKCFCKSGITGARCSEGTHCFTCQSMNRINTTCAIFDNAPHLRNLNFHSAVLKQKKSRADCTGNWGIQYSEGILWTASGCRGTFCINFNETVVRDCNDQLDGNVLITTMDDTVFQTQCLNGWLVFAKRFDGSVDFYRNWEDYKSGFGDVDGEYFLGFNHILSVLKHGSYQLRIELTTWPDQGSVTKYAEYSTLDLAGESEQFRITVSGYSGTAGDSMWYNNNMKFSTRDQDHDTRSSGNCATQRLGAWWHKSCTYAHLYGPYMSSSRCDVRLKCMYWHRWPQRIGSPDNYAYSFREMRMMIRRV
ncbi:unnamed protein product [Owenia fusiformis]|uniref:Uncharacterized protein n=1 Tax=Owenia fusiformis TaxID=6347 RepID=A0A8J1XKH5_OWEFU|nr:unnamed protein product [Owenia fusiformis]